MLEEEMCQWITVEVPPLSCLLALHFYRYMSLGVVDAVAETPAACESFHIPFQSVSDEVVVRISCIADELNSFVLYQIKGSNEVLAAMGRGHTREKYLHIVDRIRSVSTVVALIILVFFVGGAAA